MKCSFCGSEIKLGSVYCQKCGKATQIVPDYNVLEDDLLPQILEGKKTAEAQKNQKNQKKSGNKTANGAKKVEGNSRDGAEKESRKSPVKTIKKLWKNKKTRWACLLSSIVALALILGIVFGLQNSYSYQYQQGIRQDKKENYEKALSHYLRAIALDDSKTAAKIKAGYDYYELEQYEKAVKLLWDEVASNPSDEELYRCLILSCLELKDYTSLAKLAQMAEGETVMRLFSQYMTDAPLFSAEEGEYDDDLSLTLSSSKGDDIYYTVDGSDPIRRGIPYQDPILLSDGETTVKAACKDDDGTWSQVVENTYLIQYSIPDYANVSPMQGTFTEPTEITMEAEEGAEIYYTWDGSDPTTASDRYTGPIPVPEGNNVLSVVVIDKHGMSSDILRCNYKYLP